MDELERAIDAPLHVIFLKNLSLLRAKTLRIYESLLKQQQIQQQNPLAKEKNEKNEFIAMIEADTFFRSEAEKSRRSSVDWDYNRVSCLIYIYY